MRPASFDVDDLFSCAKAFDAEDGTAAKRAPDASARFDALIATAEYTDAARMRELLGALGLAEGDESELVQPRRNRGDFLVRR